MVEEFRKCTDPDMNQMPCNQDEIWERSWMPGYEYRHRMGALWSGHIHGSASVFKMK